MKTHCDCGAKLPAYSGRGRRPSKCAKCKRKRRRTSQRANERWRYEHDPAFRAMKKESVAKWREGKRI